MKHVISGAIACMERKQKMDETSFSDEITYLRKQIEVEKRFQSGDEDPTPLTSVPDSVCERDSTYGTTFA